MIISSLLETDLYKYTMQYVVFKKFPDVEVKFKFKNRTSGIKLSYDLYAEKIKKEIYSLSCLEFKPNEIDFLTNLEFFSKGYLEYLEDFRFNPSNVIISKGKEGEVEIYIKGLWLKTILYEVPLLAIISELYSDTGEEENIVYGKKQLDDKISTINMYNKFKKLDEPFLKFTDFGTRRRYSRDWQDYVVKTLSKELPHNFVGTSNVYLAMKYNIKPIGTMAHEYIQAMQSLVRIKDSQKYAFQTWADVYRGDLGIALSDTLGMNAFFKDFDLYFSKLFDGARHDSGDPFVWGDKLLKHYKDMEINPIYKHAIFSDGLNVEKMIKIYKRYKNRINVSFGIGTNLTNDCNIKPLQIVIKMVKCDEQNVCKISDSPGKQMCEDDEYIKYVKETFKIEEKDE